MFTRIFAIHRRERAPRSTAVVDRRAGTPDRHRPEPMPRIRWYA
jgi:hypothetical protein